MISYSLYCQKLIISTSSRGNRKNTANTRENGAACVQAGRRRTRGASTGTPAAWAGALLDSAPASSDGVAQSAGIAADMVEGLQKDMPEPVVRHRMDNGSAWHQAATNSFHFWTM